VFGCEERERDPSRDHEGCHREPERMIPQVRIGQAKERVEDHKRCDEHRVAQQICPGRAEIDTIPQKGQTGEQGHKQSPDEICVGDLKDFWLISEEGQEVHLAKAKDEHQHKGERKTPREDVFDGDLDLLDPFGTQVLSNERLGCVGEPINTIRCEQPELLQDGVRCEERVAKLCGLRCKVSEDKDQRQRTQEDISVDTEEFLEGAPFDDVLELEVTQGRTVAQYNETDAHRERRVLGDQRAERDPVGLHAHDFDEVQVEADVKGVGGQREIERKARVLHPQKPTVHHEE